MITGSNPAATVQHHTNVVDADPHARVGMAVGAYLIVEELGVGGMAHVYKGYHTRLARYVALKFIQPDLAAQPGFLRDFEREAKTLARLSHPNIVTVHDFGETSDTPSHPYLVMEYVAGRTLKDWLPERGHLTPEHAFPILKQVGAALDYAHAQGVVHRDIKPTNILLTPGARVLLSDFGIAKLLTPGQAAVETQSTTGTPAYMAPEQVSADLGPISPATDVYALGVVLYEMLTGRLPFEGDTNVGLMAKRLHEDPVPPRDHLPDLPEAVEQVVLTALARDPQQRYPSANALVTALIAALPDLPPDITPSSGHTPVWWPQVAVDIPPEPGLPPFKGLQAFDVADAALFFGREALTAQLVARVQDEPFLAIVGASGSGKSSLVRAGLVPALQEHDDTQVHILTPGEHPLESLALSLTHDAESIIAATTLVDDMTTDPRSLRLYLRRRRDAESCVSTVLVIDQFEELFTLCDDLEERQAFIANLLTAAMGSKDRAVTLVLTLRADFYHHCAQYADLRAALQKQQAFIGAMTEHDLRTAIEEPAKRNSWALEPGLVDLLLRDVGDEPGGLPLLSHALLETWKRRRGRTLTLGGYAEAGGVRGAIAKTAEDVYQRLDETQQILARAIFLRLTELGEGTQDTRRRVTLAELHGGAETADAVHEVLNILAGARLITLEADTAQVAHEALIREWPTLRGWLEESRADIRTQRLLGAAAREWLEAKCDPSFLLHGTRLDQFETWARETDLALTETERAYLEAGLAEQQKRQAAQEARQQREAALKQRARRILQGLVGVFALAALIAVILTIFAFSQRRDALESYSLSLAANAQQALVDKDSMTAMVLALEANRIKNPPAKAQQRLLEAAYVPGPCRRFIAAEVFKGLEEQYSTRLDQYITNAPTCVDINPKILTETGNHIALTGFADSTIILWELETGREIRHLEGHTAKIYDVAFSPDGKTALSTSGDRSVIFWDVETGQEIHHLQGHAGWVTTVAFSPDGHKAVSGGYASDSITAINSPGELILWDLGTGHEIRRFIGHPSGIQSVAFSPNGREILASSGLFSIAVLDIEYSLILWNVETGEIIRHFEIGAYDNYSIAISPDGQTALTAAYDQNIYLWDMKTGKEIQTLRGHNDAVTAVVFTPEGHRAVSGSWDNSLILWDLQSGTPIMHTQAHDVTGWDEDIPPVSVAVTPDGRTALSSADDGTLVLWDLFDAGEIRRFVGHTAPVAGVDLTPDEKYALTGSGRVDPGAPPAQDNTMRLWDIATGEQIRVFEGHTDTVFQVAASSDGRKALSGSLDGSVRLWDLETGEEIQCLEGHSLWVFSIALSPDDRRALSGSTDHTMILWDLESGKAIRRFAFDTDFTKIVFSPDGRTAYTSGGGRGPVLWDLETGQIIRRWSAPCCNGFALNPKAHTIVTTYQGGQVFEWDLETDQEIRRFDGHSGIRVQVAINQDGRTMIFSDWDGTLSLWNRQTMAEIRKFKSYDNGAIMNITLTSDGNTALVSGSGGAAILWNLTVPTIDELREWIATNRYVRDLTCEERETYQIEPLCDK